LLITICLIAQAAGFVGSLYTVSSVGGWYLTIQKPTWNPPSWVFGPVWVTLYALMGVAAAIVWQRQDVRGASLAIWIYAVQLLLNVLWSFLFFGLKNPGIAFAEIVALWIAILMTTVLFWKVSSFAGALMLPYLAWVSFALYLNFTIWRLN
jgi:tryptophan-rich sensory protein